MVFFLWNSLIVKMCEWIANRNWRQSKWFIRKFGPKNMITFFFKGRTILPEGGGAMFWIYVNQVLLGVLSFGGFLGVFFSCVNGFMSKEFSWHLLSVEIIRPDTILEMVWTNTSIVRCSPVLSTYSDNPRSLKGLDPIRLISVRSL
jgi:hypothetical protein